ncbi:UDP-N-acetylmuramoyl-L-alanine--D-glutamate ligase [Reichenbachiella sp. MSK19-1]|uniref:UDP-N-acetylmuramoyl-L-alanine--D-glutamate ligase n=1 Tax=Reichenbachiella sp. MSK19-1 TaxID=1897631 RepID=UPI00210187A4|nr:UDP-N-acetylmuramoyl-L-alanine--D-glutamate ligase [Reichenbachiella sp. MSK19-1]
MTADWQHSVAILGSGESGMGAARLAVSHGLSVFLSDGGSIAPEKTIALKSLGVDLEENGHTVADLIKCKEVVKSPGIPDTAPVVQAIKAAGIPVISEIEFASRYTDAKIIGITGSNGKTTTTLLTTHLLKGAGVDAKSAGNVGNSFSELLLDGDPDVVVLELSSFQLDDIANFKPDVAVLLNITPDHLNRYDYDMSKYAAAKWRLFENMTEDGLVIYNQDDEWSSKGVAEVTARKQAISVMQAVTSGAYFSQGQLNFTEEEEVILTDELALIGQHNYYNQMAAILAAMELGVSFQYILSGLQSFVNAPHRLEKVGVVNDVTYINDSKATNVDAVYYALDAVDTPIVWIAGGVNKGNDYAQIKSLVQERVTTLICLGKDNAHLIDEFSGDVEQIIEVSSAAEAVTIAYQNAKPQESVLLSPACASFDLFSNYEDRGDQFKREVFELKTSQSKVLRG